jgi:hypothetical protein
MRKDAADEVRALRRFVLDEADGARNGARISLLDAFG